MKEETERKLLADGWEKEEHIWGTLYIDKKSAERGDLYALLQKKY